MTGSDGVLAAIDTAAADLRPSVRATYDSLKTGPAYHVTSRLGNRTVTFQEPIPDPFVRHTVSISWWDVLRSAMRWQRVRVTVLVGGDPERVHDVLELDDDALIAGRTRHAAFRQRINVSTGAGKGEAMTDQ